MVFICVYSNVMCCSERNFAILKQAGVRFEASGYETIVKCMKVVLN